MKIRLRKETMRKPGKIALATPENFTVLISTPAFPSPPLRIVHDSNDRGGLITKHIDLFVALLFALACCTPFLLSSHYVFGPRRCLCVHFYISQLITLVPAYSKRILTSPSIFAKTTISRDFDILYIPYIIGSTTSQTVTSDCSDL